MSRVPRRWPRRLATGLGAVLVACVGPGAPEPIDSRAWVPQEVPRGVDGTVVPEAWTEPSELEHSIDLATTLRLCGARDLASKIARAQAAEAGHVAQEAEYWYAPLLVPGVGLNRYDGRIQNTVGEFLNVDKRSANAGGAIALELDAGEALFESLAAHRRAEAAADAAQSIGQQSVVLAARRYFELAGMAAQVAVAADDVAFAKELLEVEQARSRGGAGLPADEARARARLAEAQQALGLAQGRAELAAAALVEQLHLEPGLRLVPNPAEAGRLLELVDTDVGLREMLGRALARHPELRAAGHEISARRAEVDQATWGWLVPEVRAGAAFDGLGPELDRLEDREEYFVGVSWRLGLGMPARQAAAEERLRQSSLTEAVVRDRLSANVVRGRVMVQTAKSSLAAARQAVKAAEELLIAMQARYENGAALLLEVLDARGVLSRARTSVLQAIAEHNIAQYALLGALGGL
ncbi:MAG: TolC family protein [Planctomycetota bacterium]|nr:TolC family protein [Planctomycetota bacterium]